MQRYINQLIEDIENLAKNPPKASFIEPPSHIECDIIVSELALVPFKPISEWTGIEDIFFPDQTRLTAQQCEAVNNAIFKLFDAMNILLIDSAAEQCPPEWLYLVITTNWNHPIQYLPNAGFDLELCTGEPMECPYGEEYCHCHEEFDFSEDEIPQNITWDGNEELPF